MKDVDLEKRLLMGRLDVGEPKPPRTIDVIYAVLSMMIAGYFLWHGISWLVRG